MFTFDENYDDYCDFHQDDEVMMCADDEDSYDDVEDDMDGDHESGLASAGWGVDESYEHDTPMYEDYYGGE
jgi:hypothetical protein